MSNNGREDCKILRVEGIVQLGQSCVCGAAALFLHVWQVGELGCGGFALVPATVTAVAQSVYS